MWIQALVIWIFLSTKKWLGGQSKEVAMEILVKKTELFLFGLII